MKRPVLFILSVLILVSVFSCQTGSQQKRVLTLGIRHESNTFSTLPVAMSDFTVWRGADALKGQKWAEVLREAGMEVIPTLHAYAWPGGVVEQSAFETFMNEILDSIKNAGRLDGIYMDMHGALHAEGYDDAQVTLIRKIRELKGNDVLISGSFDLHGNLSPGFVEEIDLLTAYRTAPHRDAEETRVRAVELLIDALSSGWDPHIEFVEIPILVPGEKSITEVEPLNSIYSQIPVIAGREGLLDASIFAGYCWADLNRSAMRVFVVASDKKFADKANREAALLAQQIWEKRESLILDVPSGSIEEMIVKASEYDNTVFISDSGDNTTAGAPGDNPQVLEALIRHNVKNTLFAGIVDEEALKQCKNTGINNEIDLVVGGKVDNVFGKPFAIKGKVIYLPSDSLIGTNHESAILDVNGIKVVIMNSRRSFVTLRDFEELDINPLDFNIVVVKLGYLYPELRDIAPVHLIALTSGFCNLDMRTLPFKRVTRPVYPLDLDMTWQSQ